MDSVSKIQEALFPLSNNPSEIRLSGARGIVEQLEHCSVKKPVEVPEWWSDSAREGDANFVSLAHFMLKNFGRMRPEEKARCFMIIEALGMHNEGKDVFDPQVAARDIVSKPVKKRLFGV